MFLQGIQRLQRGERGLAVVFRLENGEEAGSGLRQPAGFFRHDLAVVNLDFQREVAHAENIVQWRPVANQMCARPFSTWAGAATQDGMRRAVGAGSFPYLYPSSSTLGFRLTGSAVPAGLEGFLDGKPTFEKVGYYRASLRRVLRY